MERGDGSSTWKRRRRDEGLPESAAKRAFVRGCEQNPAETCLEEKELGHGNTWGVFGRFERHGRHKKNRQLRRPNGEGTGRSVRDRCEERRVSSALRRRVHGMHQPMFEVEGIPVGSAALPTQAQWPCIQGEGRGTDRRPSPAHSADLPITILGIDVSSAITILRNKEWLHRTQPVVKVHHRPGSDSTIAPSKTRLCRHPIRLVIANR